MPPLPISVPTSKYAGLPGWSLRASSAGTFAHSTPQRAPERTRNTQAAAEWRALGFNCGGTVLAWMGAFGTVALTPATAGAAGAAVPFAVAGALASSYQCVFSIQRTRNAMAGNTAANDALDGKSWYVWSMRGADVVGLLGAGAALKELKAANTMVRSAGTSLDVAAASTLNRVARRELSVAFGLNSAEAGSHVINQVVRQRLLEGVGGALGIVGSMDGGVLKEAYQRTVVVWITSEKAPAH